jgi:AmmeMemoRadiSam system protein B/AmmeMemoRadiSam system protein A
MHLLSAVYIRDGGFHPMKHSRALALSVIVAASLYFASSACLKAKSDNIRPPAKAGSFYQADSDKLKLSINQFLKDSPDFKLEKPIAVIAPHAGYIYAGQIYADAYRQVMGRTYDVVVILGANHTTPNLNGIALYPDGAFRTPLGTIAIDEQVTAALLKEDRECIKNPDAHANEHSIEVQIPFIQTLFPGAKIVPAVIHPPDPDMCIRFGQTLAKVLKNRNALIVISTDLSHYPSYENAVDVDRKTLEAIAELNTKEFISYVNSPVAANIRNLGTRACGEAPLIAGMTAAISLGATRGVVTGYANSGDVAVGDRGRVVGYGSVALTTGKSHSDTSVLIRPKPPTTAVPLEAAEKQALLAFARETIKRFLIIETFPPARGFSARLSFPQGAFVTLQKNGQLRGCIGHLSQDYELGATVGHMAYAAAFEDPRFPPVALSELKDMEIEISALTPLKAISGPDEIKIGRDGVVIKKDNRSAVFLPQVAVENNWSRDEMLDHLCIKAGLEAGSWKKNTKFYIFQADVFSESKH